MISNLSEIWKKADIKLKLEFQKIMFPKGVIFDGIRFQTPLTSIIFKYLDSKFYKGGKDGVAEGTRTPGPKSHNLVL